MTLTLVQKNTDLVYKPAQAPARKSKRSKKNERLFTLLDLMIALTAAALLAGGVLTAKTLVESSHIRAQIAQIDQFDSAVAIFYGKYGGMPGDLLAVSAERYQLPYGDGTPGHSDGDGKISPCNLGWQWHLGCETALFWAQLSITGLIPDNLGRDTRLADYRLQSTSSILSTEGQTANAMESYLPHSPLSEGVYVAIWNTDIAQASPSPQLPYGNYYEITRVSGVRSGQMVDSSRALTPSQARAIDEKIDDGSPRTGRVVINGDTNWPEDAWGTLARPSDHGCIASDHTYNTYSYGTANVPLCHMAIALTCCDVQDNTGGTN